MDARFNNVKEINEYENVYFNNVEKVNICINDTKDTIINCIIDTTDYYIAKCDNGKIKTYAYPNSLDKRDCGSSLCKINNIAYRIKLSNLDNETLNIKRYFCNENSEY